ncbi:hypothetical protein Tco_0312664 [Tanacetum coccineum]
MHTERGDGIAIIKRRRQDLHRDDVRDQAISLAEHINIKLTLLVFQLKLIEIGLLDLCECELELLHGKEGLVESSVLDDVKDDLLWEPMPLHEQLDKFPLDS